MARRTSALQKPPSSLNLAGVGQYVASRHTPGGGYSYYRTPEWGLEEPNAPDTLAALECLRMLALEPPASERTARWLRALQTPDGGYATLTIGWAALRALDVLGAAPSHSPHAWLRRRGRLLLGRDRLREWRSALGDALRLAELARLTAVELDDHQRRDLVRLLQSARGRSGGWGAPGADLHTTWVAVRLASLAGVSRHPDAAVAAFLRGCEDEALGLRLAPGAGATSAEALCGGLELIRALGLLPTYPRQIAVSIALLQRSDGGLAARHRGIATLRDTWLGVRAAQLLQLTQEETQ
jgi:hypothetical protein